MTCFSETRVVRHSWILAPLLGLGLLSGCWSGGGPETASVSGAVTLDGQPIGAGSVLLVSERGLGVSAELQRDGKYAIRCLPGKYFVAVSPPPPADPLAPKAAPAPSPEVKIPKPYQDAGTSGLLAEVKDGTNSFDFSLDSKFRGQKR